MISVSDRKRRKQFCRSRFGLCVCSQGPSIAILLRGPLSSLCCLCLLGLVMQQVKYLKELCHEIQPN